jgi:hypothetical protein
MLTLGKRDKPDEWEYSHNLLLKTIPAADRAASDICDVIYRNVNVRPKRIYYRDGPTHDR